MELTLAAAVVILDIRELYANRRTACVGISKMLILPIGFCFYIFYI